MIAETMALLKHLREIEPHSQAVVDRCDAEIEWLEGLSSQETVFLVSGLEFARNRDQYEIVLVPWRHRDESLVRLRDIDWTAINHPQANAEADVEIVRIK